MSVQSGATVSLVAPPDSHDVDWPMGYPIEQAWLDLDGVRIHCLTAGEAGQPVVLIHGGGVDSAAVSWRFTLEPLSREYRVFAPDLPGFGASGAPKGGYTTDAYAAFLLRLLDRLGLDRAHLAGVSMGGAISLRFALDRPERLAKLVLVDSHGLGGRVPLPLLSYPLVHVPLLNRGVWWLIAHSRWLVRRSLESAFYEANAVDSELVEEARLAVRRPDATRAFRSWQRSEITLRGFRSNFVDRLSEISVPTLLVHGEHDPFVPVTWARSAYPLIKGSKLYVIPDCGHWPQREKPAELNRALTAFLRSESSSPRQSP